MIRPNLIITSTEKLYHLFDCLICKKDNGFVFRGQSHAKWGLEPKLFRKGEIEKLSNHFPLSDSEIQKSWFENEGVLSDVDSYFSYKLKINKLNYHQVIFFHKGKPIPLVRLFSSYINIMKYNYFLYQHTYDNQSYYADEYLEQIKDRSRSDWASFSTFSRFLQEILYLIDRREIYTNELLNSPEIFDGISSYDETRPQHYDIATSVLDWTKNPYKALYFAFKNFIDNDSKLIVPRENTHVSVYAYKQLQDHRAVPVLLKETDIRKIENERVEKQEGVFTCMPMARSFYLINNMWPKLDDYFEISDGKQFLVEKYVIELNKDTVLYVQKKLKELDINIETMGLLNLNTTVEKIV